MRPPVKCCLWVAAALLPLLLGASSASPLLDSSGEEQPGEDPSAAARTSPARDFQVASCKRLALVLRKTAFTWKEELCKEQTICKNNTEIIPQNDLRFPKISVEEECPPRGNKERCLRGISSGLYTYQPFLEYIEKTFISKCQHETAVVWLRTKHLANTLKSMMNTPDTVTTPSPVTKEALSTQLQIHTGWNRKVIHYLILQDYISFMEKTVRAMRAL